MKLLFTKSFRLWLALGIFFFFSHINAQESLLQLSPFSENQISYKDNGAILFNKVTIDPGLKDYLLKAEKSEAEKTIIFTFESPEEATAARKKMLEIGAEFVGPEFLLLPMQGANVTASEALAITEIDGTMGLWEDRPVGLELHEAVIVSSVKDTWDDQVFTDLNNGMKLSGRGVGVVVNDSGFDGSDSDIQTSGETIDGEPFYTRMVQNVNGANNVWDEDAGDDTDQAEGHGSHVMGIVGGDGRHSGGKYTGVAPGASLIGYTSAGAGLLLGVAGGFEYAKQHKDDYNIRIITNSFGAATADGLNGYDPTEGFAVASKAVSDAGIIVVFSAGNSGPEDNTITGNYKISPWVTSVGNGLKSGALAGSSSRGVPDPDDDTKAVRGSVMVDGVNYQWENRPTLTAPGSSIVASRATAGANTGLGDVGLANDEKLYYTHKTGTSMAAPHVAGIVALMVEANPDLEWRAVKAILQRTAIDAMAEKFYQRGAGYVNAHAATAAAFYGLCDVAEDATYEDKYGLPTDGSFGFETDPWKTCPLNDEVFKRLKETIPLPTGVEVECAPNAPITTDANGDAASPHFDIVEVRMFDETATDFKISLEMAGGMAGAQGVGGVAEILYGVRFTLTKGTSAEVAYIVNAIQTGAIGQFNLRVIRGDNPNLGSTNSSFDETITGEFDLINNIITWTVPKNLLDAEGNPDNNDAMIPRSGIGAQKGNNLINWQGIVRQRAALSLVANLDDTSGGCFRVLVE